MTHHDEDTHTPPSMLAVAMLLTRLYAWEPRVELCWRRHYSGGAVLEDIRGRVLAADPEGSSNCRAYDSPEFVPRECEPCLDLRACGRAGELFGGKT